MIGQRVVVRRILRDPSGGVRRGPTGGPAFTDVLGVCLAWGESHCEIAPDDAEVVRIALADIVSGKPVPPRPSARARVGVREAELHTASLWPHLQVEGLGEWQLRLDPAPVGRPLKRANSCLAIGDPGLPLTEALLRVVDHYAAHGRPALVQAERSEDGTPTELESALEAAGWERVPGGDNDFLLGSLARARRLVSRAGADSSATPVAPRERWEIDGDHAVLILGARAPYDGDDWVIARAALDGVWLGLHGLAVAAEHRRRGLGRLALAGLLEWGAEQGARTVWLHVEPDNLAAYRLYEQAGMQRHHSCSYWRPA